MAPAPSTVPSLVKAPPPAMVSAAAVFTLTCPWLSNPLASCTVPLLTWSEPVAVFVKATVLRSVVVPLPVLANVPWLANDPP